MRRRDIRAGASGLLLAALVAACAPGGPAATPVGTLGLPAGASPSPWPSGDNVLPGVATPAPGSGGPPPSAEAVPAEAAWGTLRTTRLPIAVGPDRYFVFSGAGTPDGRYLVGSLLRNQFLDTKGEVPGDVVIYEIATKMVQKVAAMQRPNSQVTSAAADDEWIVWQEADDAEAFDWYLFAYHRSTGDVKEIARAATKDGRPVPGPFTFVSVGNGTVVWGQGIGSGVSTGSVANAAVMRADLASGRVETVAEAAGSPALSWPLLAWEEFPVDGTRHVEFVNLETGWTGTMATVPATIVLSGGSAAFSAADLHSIWLLDDVTDPSSAVEIAHGTDDADYLQWPTLNERILAWAQDDSSVVYDRAQHRLVALPVTAGWSSGMAAGPNLVWFESDAGGATDHPDWLVVADTRTLPVTR